MDDSQPQEIQPDSQIIAEDEPEDSTSTPHGTYIPPSADLPKILSAATYSHHSAIPSAITADKTAPVILGVDEAGRGPVLGPMVYAVAYILKSSSDILKAHSFDDSKKLTASTRSSLLRQTCTPDTDLYKSLGWSTTLISPRDISAGMLRASGTGAYNLNAQAHDITAELIRAVISMGVNVTEIYVDTVGPAATYQAKLSKLFPTASVTVTKKADSLFPIVSAASVCAKVTRDAAIEICAHLSEHEFGSGYPGDEKTKQWLKKSLDPVFGWDRRFVRFSWGPAKNLLEEGKDQKGVGAEWPEEMEEGEQNISGFFEGKDRLGGWYGKSVQVDF